MFTEGQMKIIYRLALMAISALSATVAQAQPIVVADSGDTAWMLSAAAVVLIAALPGFALFQRHDRSEDDGSAMLISVAVGSLVFAVIGYSLAFGEGSSLIGGSGNAMLANMAELRANTTISDSVYAVFQLAIALFAISIIVSSIADTARVGWLVGFVSLWSLVVYAPIAHWIWGDGWLAGLGVLDFSGGLVVQVAAGTSTLVIALLLGRGSENVADDSKLPLAGLCMIWIGWLGVVGGSALGGNDDAATAMLNAHFAASAALLTGFAITRWRRKDPGAYGYGSAAIAGLAAISTGAAYVGPAGAMALGGLGAVTAWVGSSLMARLNLGATSGAFFSCGCGGIIGAIAFPVFVLPAFGGPGFDAGVSLLTQIVAQ
jgi:Amt family ammonium transporter